MISFKFENKVTIDMSSNTFKLVETHVETNSIVSLSTLSLTERDLHSKGILNKIKRWCFANIKDLQAPVSILLSLKDVIIYSPCMIKSFNAEEQLEWELKHYIGESLDAYSWDYHITKEHGRDKWAMSVACRDSVLERIKQLFPIDKINLVNISVDVFGTMNCLHYINSRAYVKEYLLLSVYEEDFYLIQVEQEQIDYIHRVHLSDIVNRFNLNEKTQVLDEALENVTGFLIKNNLNHSQKKIVISGDISILAPFKKMLLDHLSNPIEILSLDKFSLHEDIKSKKNIAMSGGFFCSAIGNNLVGAK